MSKTIKTVAVIGAGVMGAQIAGHLANCGFKVLLLDILPPADPSPPELRERPSWRNSIASSALEKLKKAKPPALFTEGVLKLVSVGNIEDNLAGACRCDWIIEVVPERLDIKQKIYSRIEDLLQNDTIISSNTSGISLELLTEGHRERFKKAFLITHFFNPVRYMKLVELVVGPETATEYAETIKTLLSERLGKGVVMAKDTPGFIANRIGVFAVMNAIGKTIENAWPIDLVDQIMGSAATFARSAIFRTADMVGLDTLMHVAKNTYDMCPDDPFRETLKPHPVVEKMIAEGRLGAKSGAGFYKKEGSDILVIDPATDGYRPKIRHKFESLKKAKKIEDPAERLRMLFSVDDDASKITRELVVDLLVYAASVAEEISDSIADIDNAMMWGYNWELGPFQMWDALGLDVAGEKTPEFINKIKSGRIRIERPVPKYSISSLKKKKGVLKDNAGAALIDIGDDVLLCEFHSKMNSIDPDVISMLNSGMEMVESGRFIGLLVANDGGDFSVGANLFMIAMAIANKGWSQIEELVRAFQDVGQRMRFSPRPVVAAPFGRTLGGGCEICLAAGNNVAAAETYMGLVELGVGLIPAGGGCKNILLNMEVRHIAGFNQKNSIWYASKDGGPFPKVADAFRTIATATVAVSGLDAARIGYISKDTPIVIDRDRLTERAKEYLLKLADGYSPPKYREDIWLPGKGGELALVSSAEGMKAQGYATDYDVVLASNLAYILAGGNFATNHYVAEQDILDMEREVFLKLCGEGRTAERIQHMLTTGKPLRN